MEISFVFKGECNMMQISYNQTQFSQKNDITGDINNDRYIESLLDLFYKNINVMIDKLNKSGHELWPVEDIKEEAKYIISCINENYIIDKDLDWKYQLDNILLNLLQKLELNFIKVNEMFTDELDQCEEIYNLLGFMFPSIEEVIEIKYKNFKKNKTKNLPRGLIDKKFINNTKFTNIKLNMNVNQEEYDIAA